jgi:hypothetical protein
LRGRHKNQSASLESSTDWGISIFGQLEKVFQPYRVVFKELKKKKKKEEEEEEK